MCENSRTIYTIATITTLLLHYKYHTNHNTNKHFLFSFSVPHRTRERKIVNKYIYQSYNKDYYNNNNPYIGNLFLPVCCACCRRVCSRREQELVKTFTTCQELGFGRSWQAGRRWERCRRQSGIGGCSHKRITAGQRWQHLTAHIENVIISITMITKMLFVIRTATMRCEAFLLFRV